MRTPRQLQHRESATVTWLILNRMVGEQQHGWRRSGVGSSQDGIQIGKGGHRSGRSGAEDVRSTAYYGKAS